ncbi:CYTH domain-containing protein [Candidatus Saccharibacteria bacterium]|nr:CYTH domain-containing protein [Candidatus Saccharibacteria bacterium]
MKSEIEIKFANQDFDVIREKLTRIDAKLVTPMRLMRRAVIHNDFMGSKAFCRIRDEGDKTAITYKQFDSLSLDGAKEIEMTVEDFDTAIELLSAIGLKHNSIQESKRETWQLGNVKIELDEWPWLNPYIELEGEDEASLREVADKLELNWSKGIFGDVMAVYRVQYPHLTEKQTVGDLELVRFSDPLPEFLKHNNSHADHFRGVIIEESLEDKNVLAKLKILSTEVEKVTEKHETPWLDKWTLHEVEVDEAKAEEVAKEISEALDIEHTGSWYADYKNDAHHYMIFSDRIFKLDRNDKSEWDEFQAYAEEIGLPKHQTLSFGQNVDEMEKERGK